MPTLATTFLHVMDVSSTHRQLTEITDSGLFERLANAVLREEVALCRNLSQLGVNEQGKTIKGPMDAFSYATDDGQTRMLAVHHTTCNSRALRSKWLGEPDGDLHKSLHEWKSRKKATPTLEATVILTSNREPDQGLLGDIQSAASGAGIEVMVKPGSFFSHFLDFDPRGQWIRTSFLGIEPSLLSEALLRDLSKESLATHPPQDDPRLWVDRSIDRRIKGDHETRIQFVLGHSGVGKTVACLKAIRQHVEEGGYGLVLDAEVLQQSLSINDSVDRTLRHLQPSLLPGCGSTALSLASEHVQLLIVVEDLNRSPYPARLLEKLTAWSASVSRAGRGARWRVLCPVWPKTLLLIGDNARQIVEDSSVFVQSFSKEEAVRAVMECRQILDRSGATEIASALGFDPLLIALHRDTDSAPNPSTVIDSYITGALQRLAASPDTYTAGEYRIALRELSMQMLVRKQMEPRFTEVAQWLSGNPDIVKALRDLLKLQSILRPAGVARDERIGFRHDRVRDHLLADAITDAVSRDSLPHSVTSEPYFAEIIGLGTARAEAGNEVFDDLARVNPLALFWTLKHHMVASTGEPRNSIEAAMKWANSGVWKKPSNRALSFAVLKVLAQCDGPHVRQMCEMFGRHFRDDWSLRGRFRNGDISAGVSLCSILHPSVRWEGHVETIEHASQHLGPELVSGLKEILSRTDLNESRRSGALRLAGFVADPALGKALHECWQRESSKGELLADYFWACSQCCGDNPSILLEALVDAWGNMPDEDKDSYGSPRTLFGADQLQSAFREKVPERAVAYFIERASSPELRWPILVMLNGIDHPDAIEFLVRELAQQDKELEDTGQFSPFSLTAVNEWSRRERYGRAPMSSASRQRLRDLWSCGNNGKHLQRRALRFWAASVAKDDISILRTINSDSSIGNLALFERLRRGDMQAIPALLERLETGESQYWWQAGRYLWSQELTKCLDRALARRAEKLTSTEHDSSQDQDWILSERLLELSTVSAERLLMTHWSGLRYAHDYVLCALYLATPHTLERAREVIDSHTNPKSVLKYLGFRWGLKVEGRRGVTRLPQMQGLEPYLGLLSEIDVSELWGTCNKNGWWAWRREHLDEFAKAGGMRLVDDAAALGELDRALARDGPFFPMDHWARSYLETGSSLEQMMELMPGWLSERSEKKALLMVADLVERFGEKPHLRVLRCHSLAGTEFGQDVIQNADFQLRWRCLS